MQAYRLGPIKSVVFFGRGSVVVGETIVDGRTVDEIILKNGRAYLATSDGGTAHIIGSLPAGPNQMGQVLRDAPEVEQPADTVAGTGDDTVTG